MEQQKRTKEVFAGASFNDAPNPQELPIPVIPEGFTVKKLKDPAKTTRKQKKNLPKNK